MILCVALFLIEAALKWLRQSSYPFLDALWSLQDPRIESRCIKGGRKRENERQREKAKRGGMRKSSIRMGEGRQ